MDMMKNFVIQELENQIRTTYPHLQYPSCMLARVIHIKGTSEKYQCTLKILDNNRQPDNRFPEVPGINTDLQLLKNDVVVVLLLYGQCDLYIIGRY